MFEPGSTVRLDVVMTAAAVTATWRNAKLGTEPFVSVNDAMWEIQGRLCALQRRWLTQVGICIVKSVTSVVFFQLAGVVRVVGVVGGVGGADAIDPLQRYLYLLNVEIIYFSALSNVFAFCATQTGKRPMVLFSWSAERRRRAVTTYLQKAT